MESARNRKSYPEDFELTQPAASSGTFRGQEVESSRQFVLAGQAWEALLSDPEIRARVDILVNERAERRAAEEINAMKQAAIAEGREQGERAAEQERETLVTQMKDSFDSICRTILAEKEALLRTHEAQWCRAMSQVLKRFLVPLPQTTLDCVRAWMEENRDAFQRTGLVEVWLSPQAWRALGSKMTADDSSNWRLMEDTSLEDGQIRCTCDGVGFYFASDEQVARLETLIERSIRGGGPLD